MQPSFVTPHAVPVFLRASVVRVVAGSLLLAGIFVGCVALTVDDPKAKLSCALSCATCMVAFYHYQKIVSIREQDGTRVTLTKPGDVPMGQSPILKTAWQELAVDAVRYSDWSVRARACRDSAYSTCCLAYQCRCSLSLSRCGRLRSFP